jgi:alpha-1,3-rhamnosyltransferase
MSKTDDQNSGHAPLVSIVIPSFNHESYVQECIKSVINQDYENIELIVIDDGSTDDSVEEIKRLILACDDRFVRFEFRTRENKGLSETLNEAIEWANGKYFSAIASDDILLANKTSVLVEHLKTNSTIAGVFSGCQLTNQDGVITGNVRPPVRCYSFDDIIMRKHTIVASTQLLRLESLRCVGGYPKDLYIEDWYMWLALTEKGFKLQVIEGELAQYRQHETNISKNFLKMLEGRKHVLSFFTGHEKYKVSLSKITVMAAIDMPSVQRFDALKLLFESVYCYPKIVFTGFFIGALLRLSIPSQLRAKLRMTKLRIKRRIYDLSQEKR